MRFLNNPVFNKSDFEKIENLAKKIPHIAAGKSDESVVDVKIGDLLSKICVSPPYFAFKKVYRSGDLLVAPIECEQVLGHEISPISIGESGRHMAILGTCACGIDQEEKNFYLVKDARIWLNDEALINAEATKDQNLFIVTKPRVVDRKTVGSLSILTDQNGNIIYLLDCNFHKIKESLFNKLFFKQHLETKRIEHSPYREIIALNNLEIKESGLVISIPDISPERCSGHFDNYPIVPTAFIIYNIIKHVGEFLMHKSNKKMYKIFNVDMSLFELVFLRTHKTVNVSYNKIRSDYYEVKAEIIQDGKSNSTFNFLVQTTE